MNRQSRIGGSDLPIIMGDSSFKSVDELFLEKVGAVSGEFGNMYTELGKILEPNIQAKYKLENDQKEIGKLVNGFKLQGNIDGESGTDLAEIKLTSSTLNKALKDYKAQVQGYMYMGDYQQCKFIVGKRVGKLKELFNEILHSYNLPYLHDFTDYDKEMVEEIQTKLMFTFATWVDITTEDRVIKRDDDYIDNELLPNIEKFVNLIYAYYEKLFDFNSTEDIRTWFLNEWEK